MPTADEAGWLFVSTGETWPNTGIDENVRITMKRGNIIAREMKFPRFSKTNSNCC
jgi:hypothetical protein